MASISTTVKIASGASLSAAVDLRNFTIVGIITPAAWTAADMTFQAASGVGTSVAGNSIGDPGLFADLFTDQGVEVKIPTAGIPIAASRFFTLNSPNLGNGAGVSVEYLKIRSGVTGVPVVQAADRLITIVLNPLR